MGLAVLLAMPSISAPSSDAISIAAIVAETGPATLSSRTSLLSIRMAVAEINAVGGVMGKKIHLLELDNQSTPIGSKVAAEKAVGAGVSAIIGANWSSHSLAAAKVAQAHRIPMISPVSTNPQVTLVGDHIFRMCFTDQFQGQVMARFAHRDLSARSAAMFVDTASDYSMELAQEFQKNFKHLGGQVLKEINYRHLQHDFGPVVDQARDVLADVFFVPGHMESALLIKAAGQAGIKGVFIGGDGWDKGKFLKLGQHFLDGSFCLTHWSAQLDTPKSRAFVQKAGGRWVLDSGSALSYDAVFLLADAISRAGSADPRAVTKALAQTKGFEGVTGKITFDPDGNPKKGGVILKIQGGRFHLLETIAP